MYENLSAYLEATVTPEQKALCMEGCLTLAEAGMAGPEDMIDQELTIMESESSDLVLNLIDNLLLPFYRQALSQLGITLKESIQLKYVTDILKGLMLLENYDDAQSVVDACQMDEDAEVILADLIDMVGQYHSIDYLEQIEEVRPELIDRIAETTRERLPAESLSQPAIELQQRARERVMTLIDLVKTEDGEWLRQRFREGLHLAMPFAALTQAYLHDLANEWKLSIDRFAISLVGLALASDSTVSDADPQIRDFAQNFIEDLDQAAVFRARVQLLLKSFLTEESPVHG